MLRTCLSSPGCQEEDSRIGTLSITKVFQKPYSVAKARPQVFNGEKQMSRPYTGVPSFKGLFLLGVIGFGGYAIFSQFSSKNWPEVTGKVTRVDIEESSYRSSRYSRRYEYTPVVHYVYLVDHVSHEGQANLRSFDYRSEAMNYASNLYAKGTHLRVLYNPNHPNFSSLHRSAI